MDMKHMLNSYNQFKFMCETIGKGLFFKGNVSNINLLSSIEKHPYL